MDNGLIAAVVFGAVVIAMMGMAWTQLLEHRRREKALDVIKTALEHGREPPAVVYQEIVQSSAKKAPWSEVVVFTSLALGFWIAFAQADGERRAAFLVVAATMTVAAFGCLALALVRPGAKRGDPGAPRDGR
jgi:hypothetical protein